jgi:hexosaminidase
MKTTWALSAIMMSFFLVACMQLSSPMSTTVLKSWQQDDLVKFAEDLNIKYRLMSNLTEEACVDGAQATERCFIAEIDFIISYDMLQSDWAIYFSQMRPIQAVLSDEFTIEQIKGDLHRITPTAAFTGFHAGQVKTLRFRGELWQLSEIDAMPNYYIVANNARGVELTPQIISSTRLQYDPETNMEIRPYSQAFTDTKRQYQRSPTDKLVWAKPDVLFTQNNTVFVDASLTVDSMLPSPKSQTIFTNRKMVLLSQGINISSQNLDNVQLGLWDIQAALTRLESIGVSQSATGVPLLFERLLPDSKQSTDRYELIINEQNIIIKAAESSGFSYGISSLSSLLNINSLTANQMHIKDSPRYDYRGMHVDVSRNFHSKKFILDLLDQMAAYKLNKLHLHMGDDEGWRLEIDDLPELTDVGSKRCHDLSETRCLLPQLGSGPFEDSKVNGFYSKADYIEIIQYANARQIQVIPSMDMPGHSRAAIKSMEVRYRNMMEKGDERGANEFMLVDVNDATDYLSVQYYDDNTLNVCMESTYRFVDKVITEIAKLHEQAGQPLMTYHIGADETAGAWLKSTLCHDFLANNEYGVADINHVGTYFIERVANMLAKKGIQPAGWSDGMSHTNPDSIPADSQSYIWDIVSHKGYQRAHQQVNNSWTTILSNPEVLYFDFPYEADPKEHGYYWGTRALNSHHVFSFMPGNLPANAEQWLDIEGHPFEADDRPQLDNNGNQTSGPMKSGKTFDGIQGQVWSETLRSDQTVEYMIYPRLLMLAERAWYKPEWEVPYQYQGAVYNQTTNNFTVEMRQQQAKQWQKMANHLGSKELAKLDNAGINYRVPTVGAVVNDGILSANIAFPGLQIEYRESDKHWQAYTSAVEVNLPVEVRAVAANGKRKGRTLRVD